MNSFTKLPRDLHRYIAKFIPDEMVLLGLVIPQLRKCFTPAQLETSRKNLAVYAASIGSIPLLEYAYQRKCGFDMRIGYAAAENGHLHILEWLEKNIEFPLWNSCTISLAAKGGKFEVMKWLRSKGCGFEYDLHWMIFKGNPNLEIVKWCCQEGLISNFVAARYAAEYGHMDIVKYFHSQNYLSGQVAISASHGGHLKILEWLYSINPNLFNEDCTDAAVDGNHFEVLKWLHSKEIPLSDDICSTAAYRGRRDIIEWLLEKGSHLPGDIIPRAAEGGHFELLKWLHLEKGCPLEDPTFSYAASHNNFEILKWLRKNNCPGDENIFVAVARNGNLEILKWLRQESDAGDPWGDGIINEAVLSGNLELLKWLVEQGCPLDDIDDDPLYIAIEKNYVDIFKWFVDRGFKLAQRHCEAAAKGGHFELLKWLRAQGCPWDDKTYKEALLRGDVWMLRWLKSQGALQD